MKYLFIILFPILLFGQNTKMMSYSPVMWVRYDTLVTSNANGVSNWTDITSHNRDWIQATDTDAARPDLTADGIDFNGTSEFFLEDTVGAYFNIGYSWTVFIRMRIDKDQDCSIIGTTVGTQMFIRHQDLNAGLDVTPLASGWVASFTNPTPDSTFKTYVLMRSTTTDAKFYIDNVELTRTAFTHTSNNVTRITTIGKRGTLNDFYFNGTIKEIIWIPSYLSDTDRNAIEYYLANGEFYIPPAATTTTRKRNFGGWGKYGGWLK